MNKVLLYRKKLKKTQKQFAEYIGVSLDAYARKERGENDFKYSELKKLFEIIREELGEANIGDVFF